MRIAVLALQGAFIEHEEMLSSLGVETFEIRQLSDWQQPKDGLILPGGESTTMMRLLEDLQLLEPIREAIKGGLPVMGTCAGLILLDRKHLGTMDIVAERNAYGRQLGSFHTEGAVAHVAESVPMTFIRAPYIKEVGPDVEVLAEIDGRIVAARQQRQIVTAFHPELDNDTRMHEFFLSQVRS
jgi:5'-phosphate synthase pdxT subunit